MNLGLAVRSSQAELLDTEPVSEAALARAYRELSLVNRWLGNSAAVIRLLRTDVRAGSLLRVLDIGCGQGALLVEIREQLGAEVVGLDVRPVPVGAPVPILCGNAITNALPEVDVTVCVLMAHHLTESELVGMIRNVARSSRRLIILDLVRHAVPLWLFRVFVAPWLGPINAADGVTSIRRAYTGGELDALVKRALGVGAKEAAFRKVAAVQHTVAPFWIRQVVDIRWK